MNKTELFKYVKTVNYPFWELQICDGFKANRIRNYNCEDIDEEATNEEKVNAALQALEITLSTFADTQKFRIILKNSKTANGSGICGPVEFINQVSVEKPAPATTAPSTAANLGALSPAQIKAMGYISEPEFNAALEQVKLDNQRNLLDMEYKIKEENLKRENSKLQEKLKRQIEEYRKATEDAESGINKTVEVAKRVAPSILGQLFGIDPKTLQGPADDNNEIEVKDAKYIEIEKLATELYDSPASLEDIIRLRNELKDCNYEFHN